MRITISDRKLKTILENIDPIEKLQERDLSSVIYRSDNEDNEKCYYALIEFEAFGGWSSDARDEGPASMDFNPNCVMVDVFEAAILDPEQRVDIELSQRQCKTIEDHFLKLI